MEPEPGLASLEESSLMASFSAGHCPFDRPGLAARVGPFALVAVVAEASLALPPGTRVGTAVIVSLVLLAAVALAFLLPWAGFPPGHPCSCPWPVPDGRWLSPWPAAPSRAWAWCC